MQTGINMQLAFLHDPAKACTELVENGLSATKDRCSRQSFDVTYLGKDKHPVLLHYGNTFITDMSNLFSLGASREQAMKPKGHHMFGHGIKVFMACCGDRDDGRAASMLVFTYDLATESGYMGRSGSDLDDKMTGGQHFYYIMVPLHYDAQRRSVVITPSKRPGDSQTGIIVHGTPVSDGNNTDNSERELMKFANAVREKGMHNRDQRGYCGESTGFVFFNLGFAQGPECAPDARERIFKKEDNEILAYDYETKAFAPLGARLATCYEHTKRRGTSTGTPVVDRIITIGNKPLGDWAEGSWTHRIAQTIPSNAKIFPLGASMTGGTPFAHAQLEMASDAVIPRGKPGRMQRDFADFLSDSSLNDTHTSRSPAEGQLGIVISYNGKIMNASPDALYVKNGIGITSFNVTASNMLHKIGDDGHFNVRGYELFSRYYTGIDDPADAVKAMKTLDGKAFSEGGIRPDGFVPERAPHLGFGTRAEFAAKNAFFSKKKEEEGDPLHKGWGALLDKHSCLANTGREHMYAKLGICTIAVTLDPRFFAFDLSKTQLETPDRAQQLRGICSPDQLMSELMRLIAMHVFYKPSRNDTLRLRFGYERFLEQRLEDDAMEARERQALARLQRGVAKRRRDDDAPRDQIVTRASDDDRRRQAELDAREATIQAERDKLEAEKSKRSRLAKLAHEKRARRAEEEITTLLDESRRRWRNKPQENHGITYAGTDTPVQGFYAKPLKRYASDYTDGIARAVSKAAFDYARPIAAHPVQGRTELEVTWCAPQDIDWSDEAARAYDKLFAHMMQIIHAVQGPSDGKRDTRRFAFVGNDDPHADD
ncbi:MAG: hypothetical protein VXA08_02950 [Alphaproteobacteria bacterium]